jgi:hypothetical protein
MRLPSRSKLKSKTTRAERCGSARMVGALESKIQVRPIPPIIRMTMRRCQSKHAEFSPLLGYCGHRFTTSSDRFRRE